MTAGPAGEETYTEPFGWVGQPWAGTGWGYQVIPRVGMEALRAAAAEAAAVRD